VLADAATTDLSLSWIGMSDGLQLSENVTRSLVAQGVFLTVADGIKLAELLVDPAQAAMEWPDEIVQLTEQGALHRGRTFDLDEIHFGETVTISLQRTIADNITLAEGVTVQKTFVIQTGVEVSESGLLIHETLFDLDIIPLRETISRALTLSIYDNLIISELLVDPEATLLEEHTEGLKLSESLFRAFTLFITDNIAFVEDFTHIKAHTERVFEEIIFGETFQIMRTRHRFVEDVLKTSDKMLSNKVGTGDTVKLTGTIEDLLILTGTIR
jgi:hypothetical protein